LRLLIKEGKKMPQIRIWNDNRVPYEEKFMDRQIKILPGKFVDMDADEGIRFLGTYRNPEFDGMGQQKVESMKMLRKELIEPLFVDDSGSSLTAKKPTQAIKCNVCGFEAVDQWHLDGHINACHLNEMADKEEQKKRMAAEQAKRKL
jgi:hypothetical protein